MQTHKDVPLNSRISQRTPPICRFVKLYNRYSKADKPAFSFVPMCCHHINSFYRVSYILLLFWVSSLTETDEIFDAILKQCLSLKSYPISMTDANDWRIFFRYFNRQYEPTRIASKYTIDGKIYSKLRKLVSIWEK